MKDFNARFNKVIKRILAMSAPKNDNKKNFYIISMPHSLGYQIRRENVVNLQADQTLAIEMEDDMIASGKWKREFQSRTMSNTTSTSNNTEAMLQKLSNELISLKKQINRLTHSFYQPHQGGYRNPNGDKALKIPPIQQRLAIEGAPKGQNMCAFHRREDHDGDTCADIIRYRKMVDNKEQTIEYPESEDDHAPCGGSNFFSWLMN